MAQSDGGTAAPNPLAEIVGESNGSVAERSSSYMEATHHAEAPPPAAAAAGTAAAAAAPSTSPAADGGDNKSASGSVKRPPRGLCPGLGQCWL